ncbi:M17 family metallopeptidase [Spiroplasma endosymbiont of Labia minor]|uniref:M17 family metallopeptidase n=1 Tax=Spiroplasma endosymbiont of Labia minor TaxID=3066305 RepID=UPI0030D2A1F0
MITYNNKPEFDITLKAIKADDIDSQFISPKHGDISMQSETKTAFLTFQGQIEKDIYYTIYANIQDATKKQRWNWNLDLDSFLNLVASEEDKEIVFDAIIESIMYTQHETYSLKTDNSISNKIKFHTNLIGDGRYERRLNTEKIKMEYTNWARDLQDTPPNIATPKYIAEKISKKAKEISTEIKVTILNKKEIEELGMGLLLAVNAASHEEPKVVIVEYNRNPSAPKNVFVGKGITFDSGGYSLKTTAFMKGMKYDMSGAAIVSAAVMGLAKMTARVNVAAIAVLTENRIGGHGILNDSVVTSYSGKTVEINNTDAEGRLVLADGITYAIKQLNAKRILDVATLTGAIKIALGTNYTGVFATDDEFYEEFYEATKHSHEEIWRMPIHRVNHSNMHCSKIADISNMSETANGGSSNAAAFLAEFAEKIPFIHLDVAGTAHSSNEGYGVMIKTLIELLKNQGEF